METSSIIVLSLVTGTVLVVCFRNIRYNRARDRAYRAYRNAVKILRMEFEDNFDFVSRFRNEVVSGGRISEDHFKTEAWLSLPEPLLRQMDNEESNDLKRIYSLIGNAEAYRTGLRSDQQPASIGVKVSNEYSLILDELAIQLKKTLARAQ